MMKKIRSLIINILLRMLGREYTRPMSPNEVEGLLISLANEEVSAKLPVFLDQCANQYRNQYLLTGDPAFKGTVLAFVSLRERIVEKKGKKLTTKKKSGKIKESY